MSVETPASSSTSPRTAGWGRTALRRFGPAVAVTAMAAAVVFGLTDQPAAEPALATVVTTVNNFPDALAGGPAGAAHMAGEDHLILSARDILAVAD